MAISSQVTIFAIFIALFAFSLAISFKIPENVEKKFQLFIKRYSRGYNVGTEEYKLRLSIFKTNYERALNLNYGRSHNDIAWYGITKFSDLTPQEFKDRYLALKPGHEFYGEQKTRPLLFKPRNDKYWKRPDNFKLPPKVDWRKHGIITPIRDQEECGACWAFSDVETIEAMNALKTGHLRKLSVQQFIDCATMGNFGCRGGDTCRALNWMKQKNVTLMDESRYPLRLNQRSCHLFPHDTSGINIQSFTCASYNGNEEEMMSLLSKHGPLVVTIDATTWNDYLGGIISYHCEAYHNHAVQIVGYDTTGPIPFYILKNSWGLDFGDEGYIYIKIGHNLCGLSDRVSSVVL